MIPITVLHTGSTDLHRCVSGTVALFDIKPFRVVDNSKWFHRKDLAHFSDMTLGQAMAVWNWGVQTREDYNTVLTKRS